jgi:restriction endonuclease S subunit
MQIPLPPLPEQTAIVEYLDAQTAKIEAAIAAVRREIELLREYRERLIADVVTGKVDVREVAAQLPEDPESPEEEALESPDEEAESHEPEEVEHEESAYAEA